MGARREEEVGPGLASFLMILLYFYQAVFSQGVSRKIMRFLPGRPRLKS